MVTRGFGSSHRRKGSVLVPFQYASLGKDGKKSGDAERIRVDAADLDDVNFHGCPTVIILGKNTHKPEA